MTMQGFAGPDLVSQLALDDGVDRLALPALPVQAVQPRLRHQVGTRLSFGSQDLPIAAHGRDEIAGLDMRAVEPGVREKHRDIGRPFRLAVEDGQPRRLLDPGAPQILPVATSG